MHGCGQAMLKGKWATKGAFELPKAQSEGVGALEKTGLRQAWIFIG